MYSWIMNAFTRTRSPTVIVRSTTPTVARHMISVTAMAMMALCVTLSSDSDVWLLTAATSHRCMLSS